MRDKKNLQFAAIIALCGIYAGFVYQTVLWTFLPDGYSVLSQRLVYWDFSNLWAGGRLATEGRVDVLFDVESYRSALRAWFGSGLPNQEWSYPPSILLIGVPLSLLPLPVAYGVWTAGTLTCLFCVLRLLKLPTIVTVALVLSPAAVMNSVFGQNGALTAALLLGTLLMLPSRPVLAGILAGLLTIKPHLGLLLPFCFLAAGQYRAIIAAIFTSVGLVLLTGLLFGFDVWSGFLRETSPLMRQIMEADYPQSYHKNALTAFILGRWLGLGLVGAYLLQASTFLLALVATVRIWRPDFPMDHGQRALLTAVLSILATPYGYSYDAIPYCVAVAFFFLTDQRLPRWPMAIAYLWPLFLHIVNNWGFGIGVLPLAIFAAAMVWLSLRDARSIGDETDKPLATASAAKPSR